MRIFTIASRLTDVYTDYLTETMWAQAFKTLNRAKFEIESDEWEYFCEGWEEALNFEVEDLPEPPPFLEWDGLDSYSEYSTFSYGITEVIIK